MLQYGNKIHLADIFFFNICILDANIHAVCKDSAGNQSHYFAWVIHNEN